MSPDRPAGLSEAARQLVHAVAHHIKEPLSGEVTRAMSAVNGALFAAVSPVSVEGGEREHAVSLVDPLAQIARCRCGFCFGPGPSARRELDRHIVAAGPGRDRLDPEAMEAAAKAMARAYGRDGASVSPRDKQVAEAAVSAYLAALPVQPTGDEEKDDARHITWDRGRRTLCGKHMPHPEKDVNGYYLPLGKAPRHDEGGAWCWSCLRLQDEAFLGAARPVQPSASEDALALSRQVDSLAREVGRLRGGLNRIAYGGAWSASGPSPEQYAAEVLGDHAAAATREGKA